jgi:hypothetical protein
MDIQRYNLKRKILTLFFVKKQKADEITSTSSSSSFTPPSPPPSLHTNEELNVPMVSMQK